MQAAPASVCWATMEWHQYAAAGMPSNCPRALAGTWAKIGRAREHHGALLKETKGYLATPPYRIVERVDGGRRTVRASAVVPPPIQLALILGDLVQNLRSALDHLAWAFALTQSKSPSCLTQFPIFERRPDEFDGEPQVRHIPESVRRIMEGMQPYSSGDPIGGLIGGQLATLRILSNRDKHRVLLLAESVVLPKLVFTNTPPGENSGVGFAMDSEGTWAEISFPLNSQFGPYQPHFEAEVTIVEPNLPWRSGLEGVAHMLRAETESAIAAFRGQWNLLDSAPQ